MKIDIWKKWGKITKVASCSSLIKRGEIFMKKEYILIANTIWFIAWLFFMYFMKLNPWWIFLPIMCHWRISDFQEE